MNINKIDITNEMKNSYLRYAMSVIVSRALPDVRDGMKPVHRRIIYVMEKNRYHATESYSKCARIVGDVMGQYHPHGDAAIYDTLVRLAQEHKMLHPLIDGQGNFGSIDGDPPAAHRYTEARLAKLAHYLTMDIAKGSDDDKSAIVPFRPNYDGKQKEPVVLPVRYPNLLVSGQMGIAVGMATNIPPHNLGETIDAALVVLDDENASLDDLMSVLPGPDFPTQGVILGRAGIRQAYATGRGSITMCGVASIEEGKRGKSVIVITEIPFDVIKEDFVKSIVELTKKQSDGKSKVEGITDIRDESNKDGIRVVVDLKSDADPNAILNAIKKFTAFQKTFSYNGTCLDSKGQPRELTLLEMLTEFIEFRRECVINRTILELDKTRSNQMRQIALYAAVGTLEQIIEIIRNSQDQADAIVRLMDMRFQMTEELSSLIRDADPDAVIEDTFGLAESQATAIVELQLGRLTRLGRDEIAKELRSIATKIKALMPILSDRSILDDVIRNELNEVKAKFSEKRKTLIQDVEDEEYDDESIIERRDMVVTLTSRGYVKRTELASYRSQRRGGKGKTGMETKDDDYVISTIVCTTKTPLLVFTEKGHAFKVMTHRLHEAAANAKGRPIVNFIDLRDGDKVRTILALPEDKTELQDKSLVFVTDFGDVRRSSASDFTDLKRSGKIAMKLEDDDGHSIGKIVTVLIADTDDDIMLTTFSGYYVRFSVGDLRLTKSRTTTGVRGILFKRSNSDRVVDACILRHIDITRIEREVYLNGGVTYVAKKWLMEDEEDEGGALKAIPSSISIEDAPSEEKPDRIKLIMSAERVRELGQMEQFLLTVTENGFGKRTSSYEYRTANRGGQGSAVSNITDRTGNLVTCFRVDVDDGLVMVTNGGQMIRTRVKDISVFGRVTQGVRLFTLRDGQLIVSVARISVSNDDDPDVED